MQRFKVNHLSRQSMLLSCTVVCMCIFSLAQGDAGSNVRVTITTKPGAEGVPVSQIAEHAVHEMKLTLPGSTPFHLKAKIFETETHDSDRPNRQSDYKADVEEYWVAPDKWRRTIVSPDFSQSLIVNGDKVSEMDRGDYFPWWLSDLITAIVDPLPMFDELKEVHSGIRAPSGGEHSTSCADFHTKVGRSVFCFEGGHGALASVYTPEYAAEFTGYRDFRGKRVATRIITDPEPGTTIKAFVTELTELTGADASLFTIDRDSPLAERIRSVHVSEDALRQLAQKLSITWPTVGGGPLTGRCAVYVSLDKTGHPREVWPGGCDNTGLQDSLREQVGKWQFRTATIDGRSVQVDGSLTFEFQTKLASK